MQAPPNASQLQKAFCDLNGVLAGTKKQAVIPVTPATRPVLELFLAVLHSRTMGKKGRPK